MNYFKELIDIYNNLKTKRISLVEQEGNTTEPSGQAIATANQHIATAHSKANLPDEDPNRKVFGSEFPLGIWEGKEKLVVWAMEHMNVTIEPAYLTNKHFRKFALLFDKGELNANSAQGGGVNANSAQGGGVNANSAQVANQSIIERMKLLLQKIQNKAKKGEWGSNEELRRAQIEGNIGTYLFGERPQSLMRQIDDCIIIQKDVSGKFSTGLVKGDTILKNNVAVSLENVLNLFIKDELTSEDRIKLNSLIAITEDGRVVIFDGMGANYGLVFSDGSKFLKNMIGNMESRFSKNQTDDKNIIEQKLSFLNGEVADAVSNKLGVLLEEVMGMVCLGNNKTPGSIKLRAHLMKKYAEKMDETLRILSPLISKLEDDKQDYATEFSAEMEALREILKGGKEELYKAIIGINSKALRARKPNRSISVGKITRLGRKADTREVYNTEKDFVRAARASGLTVNESGNNSITIEDAYGDQPENKLMRGLDEDYLVGQQVWCLEVSYKHYVSDWDPSLGSVRSKSIVSFMQGLDLIEGNENDKAAAQKHRNAMHNIGLDLTNPDSSDAKRISAYHKKHQDDIFTQVNAIRNDEDFKKFKNTLIETLKGTSIYSELYGKIGRKGEPGTRKRLMEILDSIKPPKEDPERMERTLEKAGDFEINKKQIAKNAIITFLQNERLSRDIEYKGNEEHLKKRKKDAEDYLATKFMLAGGSNDDSLIMDMRLIGLGNHAVFPHNEALAMVRAWREGKENYKLTRNGNTFTITGGSDKTDFIEIYDIHGKTGHKSSESKVTIGKGTWARLNRVRPPLKSQNASKDYPKGVYNMILEYLNSQKTILTSMFKVISENY